MTMTKSESGKIGGLISREITKKKWNKVRSDYYKNPKQCENPKCTSIISFRHRLRTRFCSHRCASLITNTGTGGLPRSAPRCTLCDKRHKMEGSLCRSCDMTRRIEFGLVPERQTLKRWFIKNIGHFCAICKISEWREDKVPLELDHIDGNAGDNKKINLRLLCPNCHAQTPTAKGKNKGNGRSSRGIPKH